MTVLKASEEGNSEWTLRAKDTSAVERAQSDITTAIEQAETMTHVGFLTLADRSAFPRIVGSKGSNVARPRVETGADITVSRENNTIVIIGTESAVQKAKEAILKQAASPPRFRPSLGYSSYELERRLVAFQRLFQDAYIVPRTPLTGFGVTGPEAAANLKHILDCR
ncbi:hypothetical protein BU15DRAFT_59137 [Melanogaster broomeanus]|nr:hypothetical protein BU15DRAFT_59137 [Melanogaster broomeanus]